MVDFILFISLVFTIIYIYWMYQILKFTKQNRIINSMTLKTILEYCQAKGVDIDISKIQKEVEDSI
jgi:hypothetical protein